MYKDFNQTSVTTIQENGISSKYRRVILLEKEQLKKLKIENNEE
jgi:hypothetical protein